MTNWHNDSGRPLASDTWLEAHHQAKLPERTAFAERIAERKPGRIVDLGCGPGLWLELLTATLPNECELIGIDSDEATLQTARSRDWAFPTRFLTLDFEEKACELPEADVYLAFNVFSYVVDPIRFLECIRLKLRSGGCLILRQYDGALLRMGPMKDQDRQLIDISLMTSLLGSGQFKHYDLDRVFQSVATSSFTKKFFDFEVFKRFSPYPAEFQEYFKNTIEWNSRYISDEAKAKLNRWLASRANGTPETMPSYFMEVDFVAWLS